MKVHQYWKNLTNLHCNHVFVTT